MTKTLIIAEHSHHLLKQIRQTLQAAHELKTDVDVLIMGHDCGKTVDNAVSLPFVKRILVADNEVYAHQLAENCADLVQTLASHYDYILANATTFGKNLLPRVAALLGVSMLSDVTQIISTDTFVRPIYAGNAMATVQTAEKIKILTIRTTTFAALAGEAEERPVIETLETVIPNKLARFENEQLTKSSRPDLTSARVVISGGRGLKSADNFHLLESVADKLGAAVGASRAAVDAGFAPNDYQVGQTGKVVAPDLYIAVGISGAIQHLAGIKDSKVIVAINNDPDAPILQVADYSLVGDLFQILPELDAELEKVH